MNHKNIFFIFLSISFLTFTNTQTCQKVQCGTISEIGVCVSPVGSVTTIQSCTDKTKECQVKSEDPTEGASVDEKTEKTYQKYPGMKCAKNEECKNKVCDETTKTCKAIKEGEECTTVDESAYGLTCRVNDAEKKVCIAPAKDQEKCIVDCEMDHGCYNNKCTGYYTVADGEFIGVITSVETSHSLCKSGFSNEYGICQSLTQEEEKTICDENKPCKYKSGEETLTLPDNCLC